MTLNFTFLLKLTALLASLKLSHLSSCVKDIDWWTTNNMLKLNQEKTELIVISSKFRPRPAIPYVSVGEY